ncbi:hypothetical protein BJF79_40580 [Actinomadura sp. CNU-125]|nr:hypothetical protein BJF79_40580 [Actinomadura sp. CNU-125]
MGLVIRLVVAAGLVVDAVVHWIYAPDMAYVQGGAISGELLFQVQAAVAGVAAVVVLVVGSRWAYALGFVVAGSAVGALLLYHYVDVGALGPLPDMYDPIWYTEKWLSLVGEGIATVAAAAGFALAGRAREREPEPVG